MNSKKIRVLNTRPKAKTLSLAQKLNEHGFVNVSLPAIDIVAHEKITKDKFLNKVDIIIFISSNACDFFYTELKQKNLTFPHSDHIIAIGESTKRCLEHIGIENIITPLSANSESLLKLDILKKINKKQVLIVKGVGGLTAIQDELSKRGAIVNILETYQRKLPKVPLEYTTALWQDDAVDIILFTSGEAIANLCELFPFRARGWILDKPCVVLSDRIAHIADNIGFKNIIVANKQNIIEALINYEKGITDGE